MGYKFMSDEWFDEVEKMVEEANIEPPPQMADLAINVTITSDDGDKQMAIEAGKMKRGHVDGAPTTITVPLDVAKKLFIDQDQSAGMQAFMSGQIKVEGDMSKLMAMQSMQASEEQAALSKKIMAMTEV